MVCALVFCCYFAIMGIKRARSLPVGRDRSENLESKTKELVLVSSMAEDTHTRRGFRCLNFYAKDKK